MLVALGWGQKGEGQRFSRYLRPLFKDSLIPGSPWVLKSKKEVRIHWPVTLSCVRK